MFFAAGKVTTEIPLSALDSTYIQEAAARVFRQFPLPGTSLHRANVMRNQQHRPITAKAPVWGSFRISSFFSLLPQEARASVVSANPSR